MAKTVNFNIDEGLHKDFKRVLLEKNETVSDNLREHISKVVADAKKPVVY